MAPRPPPSLRQTTGFLLAWVAADAQRQYEAALAEVGLTAHEVGVLTLLAEGPQKQARIGEALEMFSAQMVGVMRRLDDRGLVQRRPHPDDKRAVLVALTASGREALEAATAAGVRATKAAFGVLTERELAAFHATLCRLAGFDEPSEANE